MKTHLLQPYVTVCCVAVQISKILFSSLRCQGLSRYHPENSEERAGSSSWCWEEHRQILLPEMRWPQFGTGECGWLFSVFYSRVCFTLQSVERNNVDSLINKFTIQAAIVKGVKHVCVTEGVHSFYCCAFKSNSFLSYHRSRANRRGIWKWKHLLHRMYVESMIHICVQLFSSPTVGDFFFGIV